MEITSWDNEAAKRLADDLEKLLRAAHGAPTPPPDIENPGWCVAVGQGSLPNLTTGRRNVARGANSGRSLISGSRCILFGDNTDTPAPDSDGFVNINNVICFWRDTGERADVPPITGANNVADWATWAPAH